MTLQEAIRVATVHKEASVLKVLPVVVDALALLIEAGKAWKDKRLFSSRLAYHLLPGETKE